MAKDPLVRDRPGHQRADSLIELAIAALDGLDPIGRPHGLKPGQPFDRVVSLGDVPIERHRGVVHDPAHDSKASSHRLAPWTSLAHAGGRHRPPYIEAADRARAGE